MSRTMRGVALCVLALCALPLAAAEEGGLSYDGNLKYRSPDGEFELDFVNRFQARAASEENDIGDSGQTFDVNRYRILLDGRAWGDWLFRLQTDLATGSLADDEGESELLLDAYVQYARLPLAQLWVGQGKVGFGRQELIDSGYLQFVDRSIASERFAHGRDVGMALVGENPERTYGYSVGLYKGNGINQRSDADKDYLAAGRLAITPLGEMKMIESDPGWREHPEPRLAVGVAVMTNKEGEGSFEEERTNTGNLEFAFRVHGLSLQAEFFTESRDALLGGPGDEVDTDGWYAQAGYIWPLGQTVMLEVAGRYAEILRDAVDADVSEAGAAVGLYLRGHRAKVQADYREFDFEGIPFGEQVDTNITRVQLQLIY